MIRAFVLMNVGPSEYLGAAKIVKEKIEKIPGVLKVEMIFGRYDIIAEVEAKDLKELDYITDKMSNIPAVQSTETFICY
jgi:DNA-binding Lrp family transcriptional regulator